MRKTAMGHEEVESWREVFDNWLEIARSIGWILVVVLGLLMLAGCGFTDRGKVVRDALVDRGAQVNDAFIDSCNIFFQRGASFGSLTRWLGDDPEKAAAYLKLFHGTDGLEVLLTRPSSLADDLPSGNLFFDPNIETD